MEEGKKVIGIFLIVIFFIVVLGVIINRTAKAKKDVPTGGGSLAALLFPDRPTPKPTIAIAEKTTQGGLAKAITKEVGTTTGTTTGTSAGQTGQGRSGQTQTSQGQAGQGQTGQTQTSQGQAGQGQAGQGQAPIVLGDSTTTGASGTTTTSGTSGGIYSTGSTPAGAESIPATGSPTILLGFAFTALASGAFLKRLS